MRSGRGTTGYGGPAYPLRLDHAAGAPPLSDQVKAALTASPVEEQPAAANRPATGRRHSLTPREIQVSELIAEGLTSDEIGRRLGIARRTAEAHAEHIMTKLGVRSRAQVAAWVERSRQRTGTLGEA